MVDLRVDPSSLAPPSTQIVEAVLDAISSGELGAGDKLASVRAAAVEALVNPNTVARAYRELELRGLVEGRNGSGVYVMVGATREARRIRRKATLDAFLSAASQALRAGHDPEQLEDTLRAVLVHPTEERTP